MTIQTSEQGNVRNTVDVILTSGRLSWPAERERDWRP